VGNQPAKALANHILPLDAANAGTVSRGVHVDEAVSIDVQTRANEAASAAAAASRNGFVTRVVYDGRGW
jgi:hypothetical protein